MSRIINFAFFYLLFINMAQGQLLPGFDANEYRDFLGITAGSVEDSLFGKGIPQNPDLIRVYESPLVGLENKWYLWVNSKEKVAWITIRGTANNSTSWLANFYAAMVAARGEVKMSDSYSFSYNFAEDPKAAVHIGWTLSTGALAETLVPKVDSLYAVGYRDFILSGHSQGGAITYLMTAHLYYLRETGRWAEPIRIKSYSSAAPKPGNLYFAYHYEYLTQGGWAFNVVNAADWVPEVPFSIQTIKDFNTVNPFTNAPELIKKQAFPKKLVLKRIYNQLSKPSIRAQRKFQRYLGDLAGERVLKTLPDFEVNGYYPSNNFSRTGSYIILQPDQDYWERYPNEEDKIFKHHHLQPYFYLLEKQFDLK